MQRLAATAQTSPFDNPTWSDVAVITPDQYAAAYEDGLKKTTRLLIARGSSPDRAEEAAQAAWAKGWERRGQLREKANVVCWINTIALNLYRSEFRRRDTGELPADVALGPATGPATIDLQKLLARCNPDDRDLLNKHYGAGFTSSEIARHMKLAPVTVRVRLMRLRRRLLLTAAAGLSAATPRPARALQPG